jgi:hypothetical protein
VKARSWWFVQGGVTSSSLEMGVLTDMLTSSQEVTPLACTNVDVLNTCVWELSTSVPLLPLCVERVMPIELTHAERHAYDVLRGAGVSVNQLMQVCSGDLTPLRLFMRPVRSWLDAVPLGVEVMNEYNEQVVNTLGDVDINWSTGDDEEATPADVPDSVEVVEPEPRNEEALRERVETIIGRLLTDEVSEIDERREFFLRTSQALIGGTAAGTCPICLSSESDCLFICGHHLCHACVVELFVSTKQQEQQSMLDQGYTDVVDGFVAPCPTCRWHLEPHEVFWVTGPVSPGGKVEAAAQLLHTLVAGGERVLVVVGTAMVELVHTVWDEWCQRGLPCRVLSMSAVTCKNNLQWFDAQPGRVVLAYHDQLAGLKLKDVAHVLLLHPHAGGAQQHASMKRAVLHAVGGGSKRPVALYQFMARDTVEEVLS